MAVVVPPLGGILLRFRLKPVLRARFAVLRGSASAPNGKHVRIVSMQRLQRFQLAPIAARLQSLVPALRDFGRGLLDLALPPRCLHCDGDFQSRGNIMLCPPCVQLIAPELPTTCGRCGAVLPDGVEPSDRCPACQDFRLKFDSVYPLGRYDGPLRDVVVRTKRVSGEALSLAVGRLLAERRRDEIVTFRPQMVVPVPMHWLRRLRRGTNNPDLLAECLGRALGIPMVRTLRRRRYTIPQKDVMRSERFRNVRGAFAVRAAGA